MVVLMVRPCTWQHIGHEQPLSVGQAYDLPDAVAEELVACGSAVHDAHQDDHSQPPERAVAAPPETGRRRRKGAA